MKEIKLTQNKIALVDDEDFERVNAFKWCALKRKNNYYVCRNENINNKRRMLFLHEFIIGKKYIDHKDHDGLNNQRSNLRPCTHSENMRNQRPQIGKTSKYKGVCWFENKRKWVANIKLNKKTVYLGIFINELDAAKAYNVAAKEHFKEFAFLNIINT